MRANGTDGACVVRPGMVLTSLEAFGELKEEADDGLPPRVAHTVLLHLGNVPVCSYGDTRTELGRG